MNPRGHARKIPISEIWACPPFKAMSIETSRRVGLVIRSAADLRQLFKSPADVAGLELRVALTLLKSESSVVNDEFWMKKCRTLFLRPAAEPIIWSYWGKLIGIGLDNKSAANMTSSLAAKRLEYRRGHGYGMSVKGNVRFEDYETAMTWMPRIQDTAREFSDESLLIFSYAVCLIAHPFSDGNGRFARAILLGVLGRLGGWDYPMVALAPVFYRRADLLRAAFSNLNNTGDWDAFALSFLIVLEDAIDTTRRYLRSET